MADGGRRTATADGGRRTADGGRRTADGGRRTAGRRSRSRVVPEGALLRWSWRGGPAECPSSRAPGGTARRASSVQREPVHLAAIGATIADGHLVILSSR